MARRAPRPRPVYWKPSIPTRVMRERAFAKRELERERALKAMPGPSLRDWLMAKLSRRKLSRRTS